MAKKTVTPKITVEKYGKTYPCEIVRSTATRHLVRFEQASGKVVERWVAHADVNGAPVAETLATPEPVAEQPAEIKPWAAQLDELTTVEASIAEKNLGERRDSDDPLMKRRNALILRAIDLGAGFAEIARARGVATSTNRGLIRVLQGGKRI